MFLNLQRKYNQTIFTTRYFYLVFMYSNVEMVAFEVSWVTSNLPFTESARVIIPLARDLCIVIINADTQYFHNTPNTIPFFFAASMRLVLSKVRASRCIAPVISKMMGLNPRLLSEALFAYFLFFAWAALSAAVSSFLAVLKVIKQRRWQVRET